MDTETDYTIQMERKTIIDFLLFFQHRKINKTLEELARKYNNPTLKIIEIGAGTKALVHKRLFSRAQFIASDIGKYPGIDQVVDITQHGALANERYDLILCMNVLEHIAEPRVAIEVMHQGLKTSGELFMVTPFLFPVHDPPYDFYRYTEYSLKKLLSKFSEVSIKKVHVFTKIGMFDRMVLYYLAQATK